MTDRVVLPADVMLGFKHFSILAQDPPESLLSDVSGYVVKGGITAIVGPSSSGKTLLMRALTNRVVDVHTSGDVVLNGAPLNHKHLTETMAIEADLLIGELTVRETLLTSVRLRKDIPKEEANAKVEAIMRDLGLSHVADNAIGTVLKRGLSGGQQRRCSVGVELVAAPGVLFLDEPTSGLDASTALTVIDFIKQLARNSDGKLSVFLSMQQPNSRLLELCDHLLLLGRGGMTFFGTLQQSKAYFTEIGFPPPSAETPTDHYLRVTDSSFGQGGTAAMFDFCASYQQSIISRELHRTVSQAQQIQATSGEEPPEEISYETSFWTQFFTLVKRNFSVAYRDPTLYYLQFMLHSFYGFLVGATFWDLPRMIDDRIGDYFSAITWLVFINSYMHVFKAHYLVQSNARFHHEHANHSYSVFSYWCAELLATIVCSCVFLPGVTIGYFMFGFPSDAFGFSLLTLYVCALAAEGTVHFISQFTKDSATAVVLAQSVLIVLCVFTGGVLISEDEVPGWWVWLQELSFFAHTARAVQNMVFDYIEYQCPDGSFSGGQCTLQSSGTVFPCDAVNTDTECSVDGFTVLEINQDGGDPDRWLSFLYLFLLALLMRLLVLFMYYYPLDYIMASLRRRRSSKLSEMIIESHIMTHRLEGEVAALNKKLAQYDPETKAASKIQSFWRRYAQRKRIQDAVTSLLTKTRTRGSIRGSIGGAKPRLVWQSLNLTLKNGKCLIDSCDGFAEAGRVTALMGPSGAGKTTLLNALSGRAIYAKVHGKVTFDGHPMTKDELDFVPQFDELNEYFSIREILYHAAELKATPDQTPRDLRRRVSQLLAILGLQSVAEETINSLTGGQRKRVSIGIGLVGQPKVLFLDEPTTGLDSTSAFSIVGYITKIARQTKVTVIMTIHQPSAAVFNSLDDLYLLEGGRLAFFGPLDDATLYFADNGFFCHEGCNPADYYLDLVSRKLQDSESSKQHPASLTWQEMYRKSSFFQTVSSPPSTTVPPREAIGELQRFRLLLSNLLTYNTRNPVYFMRGLQLVGIGLFLGTLYLRLDTTTDQLRELSGAAFFNLWVVLFSVVAGAPTFCRDRRRVQQDVVNGAYKFVTHCVAQFVASWPVTFLCALAYQGVFHWLVGFNDTFEAYIHAVIVSFQLMLLMEAIVLCVVEGLKVPMLSVTFSMIVLGMLFLFAGFFIRTDDMAVSVQWITYVIPSSYALEGALDNVFSGQDYDISGTSSTVSGDQLLMDVFGHDDDVDKWANVGIVFAWVIFYRFVHYGLLWFTNRKYGIVPNDPVRNPPAASASAGHNGQTMILEEVVSGFDEEKPSDQYDTCVAAV